MILVDTLDKLFKIQLNKKDDSTFGEKVSVQKIRISTKKSSLLSDLNARILDGFKELQEPEITFDLFWKDREEECIRVYNNENLLDAMKEMPGIFFSLYALMYNANEREITDEGSRVTSLSGAFNKKRV